MCGVAGIWGMQDAHSAGVAVQGMLDAMAHRGPDAQGIISVPGVTLGHKRLKIIDLSKAADQPFVDQGGRFSIVFNGEIYNFKEIAQELQLEKTQTNSDTEILLSAFARWGKDCLRKLNGMFAFAIYDKEQKELFIARDRLGIKPLYYHLDGDRVVFASELAALLKSGLVPKELNQQALPEYLAYHTVLAPQTLVKDVQVLEPGNYMILKGNQVERGCYWQPDISANNGNLTESDVRKRTRELLRASLESRMISDVPIGAFLSGGIDSSAVVGLMAELSNDPINTFTVAFDEQEFSEKEHAAQVAKRFNTRHHVIELQARDLLNDLPDVLQSIDHPSVDGPNTYTVSKATKKAGITVAMSGLGGDELFAGYPIFKVLPSLNGNFAMQLPRALRKGLASFATRLKDDARTLKFARLLASKNELASLYPQFRNSGAASEYLGANKYDLISSEPFDQLLRTSKQWPEGFEISQISYLEMNAYMQSILLRDTDRMSMSHALEVRVPFLDHELVDYVLSLPDTLKPTMPQKHALVDALGELLPTSITQRSKMGFTFPWTQWLQNELRATCEKAITSNRITSLFGTVAQKRWNLFLKGNPSVQWTEIWSIVVLSAWMDRLELELK